MESFDGLDEKCKINEIVDWINAHGSGQDTEAPIQKMKTELEKLRAIERQLTLIRDDFSGYAEFIDRNIRLTKQLDNARTKIVLLRDNLYDKLPTGNVDIFELIKVFKDHIKELDQLKEEINASIVSTWMGKK